MTLALSASSGPGGAAIRANLEASGISTVEEEESGVGPLVGVMESAIVGVEGRGEG